MKRMFIILLIALFAGCEKDYSAITNPKTGGKEADAPISSYAIDWKAAADSASTAFIERFFCSEPRNGENKKVFSYSEYNRRGDNGSCYWQQAHAMAVMVEYYLRNKDADPALKSKLESYFDGWFKDRGNNYEWTASYLGTYGFGCNYTDDTIWIAIALMQLHEATGVQKYYDAVKSTWDECVRPRFALNKYGWLPWRWDYPDANECTNGPGAILAAWLARYAKEAGDEAQYRQYLEEAYKCFDQNIDVMSDKGTLGKVPLSYTQGTCMEAGRLIWHLTGDEGYIRKAILAARGQMSKEMCEIYENHLVMRNEGTDNNNCIFHAVFYHWAARMATDKDIDKIDSSIRAELKKFVNLHATYYWTRGIDKTNWNDSYFSTRVYQSSPVGFLGSYAGGAQAIESMCLIEKDM